MATRPKRPFVAPGVFEAALSLHQQGRLREAESLYRTVLKAQADHAGSLHHLGVLGAQQRRLDEAIRLIRRALSANPNSAEILSDLGVALEGAKRNGRGQRPPISRGLGEVGLTCRTPART